jgi:hypothetical protein
MSMWLQPAAALQSVSKRDHPSGVAALIVIGSFGPVDDDEDDEGDDDELG